MVGHALDHLRLAAGQLLMIENVGNLVCPAEFDLGEAHKVESCRSPRARTSREVSAHVPRRDVMVLNKVDLLPYLQFDVAAALANARRVNPRLRVLQLSATTGEGLPAWLAFLREGASQAADVAAAEGEALRHRAAHLQAQLAMRIPR